MSQVALDTAVESVSEPIVAWRAWTIAGSIDGSLVRLLPIAGDRRPWPARKPVVAACKRSHGHVVPGFACTCGVHATRHQVQLRRARDPGAIGTVALWGRVVEHELGFRAAVGYPQRLRLVCPVCFWQWGPTADVDSVGVSRGGRMTPLCSHHAELCARIGYRFRARVPARTVEMSLLAAYAVDLLPV
jgi:hypothetical protein